MKKIILLAFLATFAMTVAGQVYQNYPQYGGDWKRLMVSTNMGLPNDTLPVDVNHKIYPHIAVKNDTIYLWSVSLQRYVQYESGGGASGIQAVLDAGHLITDPGATIANDPTNLTGTFSILQGDGGARLSRLDVGYQSTRLTTSDAAAANLAGMYSSLPSVSVFGSNSRQNSVGIYTYLNSTKWQYAMIDSNKMRFTADTISMTGAIYMNGRTWHNNQIIFGVPGVTPTTSTSYPILFSRNGGTIGDGKYVGAFFVAQLGTSPIGVQFGSYNSTGVGIFTNNGLNIMAIDTIPYGVTIGRNYAPAPNHVYAAENGLTVQGEFRADSTVRFNDLPTSSDTTTYKPVGRNSTGHLAAMDHWRGPGGGGGGSGTVTDVDVATANGFAGTVATSTSTPVITLETTVSANQLVYSDGTGLAGSAGFKFDGGSSLDLGAAGIATGEIEFGGTTSGSVLLRVKDAAGSGAFYLPDANGTDGDVLTFQSDGTTAWEAPTGGTSYTFSTGTTNTGGTITANLSTGVSGGQSVIGGTASGNNLTLSSTSNATKGKLLFGTSAYDEVNNRLGIGRTSPSYGFDMTGTSSTLNVHGSTSSTIRFEGNSNLASTISMTATTYDLAFTLAGNSTTFFGRQSNGFWGVGPNNTSPSRQLDVLVSDALTNTTSYATRFRHVTSATAAAGSGIGVEFESENGSGTQRVISAIEAIYNDVTNSSEDADVFIKAMRAGTLTNQVYIGSTGRVGIGGLVQATTFSTLDVNGSIGNGAIRTITSDATIDDTDNTILVDAATGNVTVTLPPAANRRTYIIKKIDASANTVTIDGNASETIDGATTKVLTAQWEVLQIKGNTTSWFKTN